MLFFPTLNRHGYSLKFMSDYPNFFAIASCENYGFSGDGTLFILSKNSEKIELMNTRSWKSGLHDVSCYQNHLVTSAADGSIQIWLLAATALTLLTSLKCHKYEISTVEWKNDPDGRLILTGSWDHSLKLWDANKLINVTLFIGHSGVIHEAGFSPFIPNLIVSVGEDRMLKLWNSLTKKSVASIQTHDSEVLSCDWSKHTAFLIATSASDGLIRCWDIRNNRQPVYQVKDGHQAVKRVRFSHHFPYVLATASFDNTTKIWNLRNPCLDVYQNHSGFVHGLDWNPHSFGELGDCSWDGTICIFEPKTVRCMRNKM